MFKGTQSSADRVRKLERGVVALCRWIGVLPLVSVTAPGDPRPKPGVFALSSPWRRYSLTLLTGWFLYVVSLHSLRFYFSAQSDNGAADWYVLSVGYFIVDVNVFVLWMYGVKNATQTAHILHRLARITIPAADNRILMRELRTFFVWLFIGFVCIILSYIHAMCLRAMTRTEYTFHSFLDSYIAVGIRGLTVIYPTVEGILVIYICLALTNRFAYLGERTESLLNQLTSIVHLSQDVQISTRLHQYTTKQAVGQSCRDINLKVDINEELEWLTATHRELRHILAEISASLSPQLLMELATSLYTTVFYMYRYTTAHMPGSVSKYNEKSHYIIAVFFRFGKLVLYMILGQKITETYKQPLLALQRARLCNVSSRIQQQIQIILSQWSGNEGYLTASNVVNIGPWLLAPIAGNVVTYLLVALQFHGSEESSASVDTINDDTHKIK